MKWIQETNVFKHDFTKSNIKLIYLEGAEYTIKFNSIKDRLTFMYVVEVGSIVNWWNLYYQECHAVRIN